MEMFWSRAFHHKLLKNIHCKARYTTNVVQNVEKTKVARHLKMGGWEIHNYGGIEELQYSNKIKIPQIRCASECLVRVHSTSVNPIDCAMLGGYGAKFLNLMRCNPDSIEFPLILGREFCGELVQCGFQVDAKKLHLGDRVWGVVPVHARGAHAEYVVVPDTCLHPAPKELTNDEAAAVLYAGLTAWSGLYITGRLGGLSGALTDAGGGANKRVLVLGGSGSVGSISIQILKSQGALVVATCSEDARNLVTNFGADEVIDYNNVVEMENLRKFGKYDIVLDCAGQGAEYAEQLNCTFDQYITFSAPLLRNIDNSGFGMGLAKNIMNLLETNVRTLPKKEGVVKWGFFAPLPHAIRFLTRLVERKKILPVIDSSYKFNQIPEAFTRMHKGHLRGKLTVTVK